MDHGFEKLSESQLWVLKQLQKFVRKTGKHHFTGKRFLAWLEVDREVAKSMRKELRMLRRMGLVIRGRGHYTLSPQVFELDLPDAEFKKKEAQRPVPPEEATGLFHAHREGFGFITPEGESGGVGKDVFVPPNRTGGALHGDRVVFRVFPRAEGRREGSVLKITDRASEELVGLFREGGKQHRLEVFDLRQDMPLIILWGDEGGAKDGDAVRIQVTQFPEGRAPGHGKVIEVLGDANEPGVDLKIVTARFHLQPEVPEQAELAADQLTLDEEPDRPDFTQMLTLTIDPETAKDFDDALSLESTPEGGWILYVHIADVAHFVQQGSVIDDHARQRGTTVYFPETAYHMLPGRLASDLCSLVPGQTRFAFSARLTLDAEAQVIERTFMRSRICSDARLTYAQAENMLAGETLEGYPDNISDLVQRLGQVTKLLHARRLERGALDFDLPEALVVMGEGGVVEDLVPKERLNAHGLVEECMLLANEAVAMFLRDQDRECLRRVHGDPDPQKLARLHRVAAAMKIPKGDHRDPGSRRGLQALLRSQGGSPQSTVLRFLALRAMMQAQYTPDHEGHYGLALEEYAHFTSPIRRYPDLLVHRALWAALQNQPEPESRDELVSLGKHCSARERIAESAERLLLHWRQVRFLKDKVGQDYQAVVVDVSRQGLRLALGPMLIPAFLPTWGLADESFRFYPRDSVLVGRSSGTRFNLGQELEVIISRVDVWQRIVECSLV